MSHNLAVLIGKVTIVSWPLVITAEKSCFQTSVSNTDFVLSFGMKPIADDVIG